MAVKVAINGFGRIGRLAFRQMFGAAGYEVVAINDLTTPKMLAHLLKYDSAQGKYALADKVSAGEDSITVDGKTLKIYKEPDANNCPWKELDVDVILSRQCVRQLECEFSLTTRLCWHHMEVSASRDSVGCIGHSVVRRGGLVGELVLTILIDVVAALTFQCDFLEHVGIYIERILMNPAHLTVAAVDGLIHR